MQVNLKKVKIILIFITFLTLINDKDEGLTTNLYSYSYSKIYLNENEAKFILNFNFVISFNITPTV